MKIIVITGSTRGIGFGLAKQFLERNHQVIISGRTQESVEIALNELKSLYPNQTVIGFKCNTMSYDDVKQLKDETIKQFGQIDFWINNAGIDQTRELFFDMNPEDYKRVIDTNVIGVMNGSHVAFNYMKEQGHGQIFNMQGFGSDGMTMNKMSIYGTSKCAVGYFSRSLAKEAKGTNVFIGRLSPGMVLTDLLLDSIKEDNEETRQSKKVFNILAEKVDTIAPYLCEQMLKNTKNGKHIRCLSKMKATRRFMFAPLLKRNIID